MSELRIASYNSTGFGNLSNQNSRMYLDDIAKQCDILLIQEHWLLDQQLTKITTLLSGFCGTAVSGMDANVSILRGRPFGGCAILWRSEFAAFIQPCYLKGISRRVCGCIVNTGVSNILLLNVYLPTDNRSHDLVSNDLDLVLHDIQCYISNYNCSQTIIGGDFNCDFRRSTAFVNCMKSFICRNNLKCVWDMFPIDYTYEHFDDKHTSIIDHFIISQCITVSNAHVVHSIDNLSGHSAILIHVPCLYLNATSQSHDSEVKTSRLAWHKASSVDIGNYKLRLDESLAAIDLSNDLHECHDITCSKSEHTCSIDKYCEEIISAVHDASVSIPHTNTCNTNTSRKRRTPGWNTYVSNFRHEATFWRKTWITHGKPSDGIIADNMRKSRREYHYAIRYIKRQESYIRKQNFLNSLLLDKLDFFKEVKRFKGHKSTSTKSLNGHHTCDEIAESFASEYRDLYNSCNYEHDGLKHLNTSLKRLLIDNDESLNDSTVSIDDIRDAIRNIKKGKSDGVYDFMSDNFVYGTDVLFDHLSKLMSLCISHGYVPSCLLLSTIIPIPKDRLGDLTSSNNYRGIALCVLCLKIFDYVILHRHPNSLSSSHHQFAYKRNSSTTQCTWLAREVVSYYNSNGSPVYACLLDCSKAFDKIRFDTLFQKLIDKGLSPIIVRFLLYSYSNSTTRVKWNGSYSEQFSVSNGVRQGAVLSPILFNIYMDELISLIKRDGVGCWMGSEFYGILIYADDILLLSPTVSALQNMLNICDRFGQMNGLDFNCKKTVCIEFHGPGPCKHGTYPTVTLNGKSLTWNHSVKHLGHVLSCGLGFDEDMNVKKGQFIGCVNNISTEFGFAHPVVKTSLLTTYGTSFYGSVLWNLYGKTAQKLYTTWNISLRRLFHLPYQTHTRFLDHITQTTHLSISLKIRFLNFIAKLSKSNNVLVHNMLFYSLTNNCSPSGLNLSRILSEFDICTATNYRDYMSCACKLLLTKYTEQCTLPSEEMAYCYIIQDLINCTQGIYTCGLTNDECQVIIDQITTL